MSPPPSPSTLVPLVHSLTLEEKAHLVAGADMWSTRGAASVDLRPLLLSDGPNGVRGPRFFDERHIARCTPCGSALGATWDRDVVRRVGEVVGDEARRQDVDIVLGPNLNLHRTPLGGRGFECLAEDPLLAGVLGAAWIEGVQSRGVAATPKHLVGNDAERSRTTVDCRIEQSVLREVYLVPFEHAARAGAWAMMAAYNRLNGTYCAEHGPLLEHIVKGEWAFDGLLMSDWFGAHHTAESALAGLDLEMPGPGHVFGEALVAAVRRGDVDEAVVDEKVARLLRLAARIRDAEAAAPHPDAGAVLAEAAAASFVLLRNEAGVLPLDGAGPRRIAVIGPNADDPCIQGGGSARVNPGAIATPLQAIRDRFRQAQVGYEIGCVTREHCGPLHRLDVAVDGEHGLLVEYFVDGVEAPVAQELRNASMLSWQDDMPGVPVDQGGRVRITTWLTPVDTGRHVFSVRGSHHTRLSVDGEVVATMDFAPENGETVLALFDDDEASGGVTLEARRPVLIEVELVFPPDFIHLVAFGCNPPRPDDLLGRAVAAAAAADVAIVVVGTNEEVEAESMDRDTTRLPGDQEELIRRVAAANPATVVVVNAATAVDMEWAPETAAILHTWFAGEAFGPALAAVLAGDREPGGRLPVTIARRHDDYAAYDTTPEPGDVRPYREGELIGYRHFDASGLQPRFAFGHGLGYTEFAYEGAAIVESSEGDGPVVVEVGVRNVGTRRGREVVQAYVARPNRSPDHAPQRLAGFASTELGAGEHAVVRVELPRRAFARWAEEPGAWEIVTGAHEVRIGRSSRDLRLTVPVVMPPSTQPAP
jgi:beta-glucosidase